MKSEERSGAGKDEKEKGKKREDFHMTGERNEIKLKEQERIDDAFYGKLLSGEALLDAYREEKAKGRSDDDIMRRGLFPELS